MSDSSPALTALSPLDGRYAAKVAALAAHFSEYGLDPRARAGRNRLARRAVRGAGHRRGRAVRCRAPALLLDAACDGVLAGRRRARQGDRAHDQSRREGGRVLAEGALRRRSRDRARRRIHPFRVHVRGHQQPRLRAHARRGAAARSCCRRLRDIAAALRALAHATRRGADAVAHARPAGDADDRRQGDRQRLRAPRAPDRGDRARAAQGQGERRGRQLQRARRRVPRRRLGAARRQGGHRARTRVQSVHDADRAARLHGGALRRASRARTPC